MVYDLLMEEARVRARKMSLRKHRTWDRIDEVQVEVDDVLEQLGKRETISVAKIVEGNNRNRVPTMIKHAVVAIYSRLGGLNETRAQRFVGAHNIAYALFKRHGYIRSNGFGMTSKGKTRNLLHEKGEPGTGAAKTNRYGSLYNSVFKRKKSYPGQEGFKHKTDPKVLSASK